MAPLELLIPTAELFKRQLSRLRICLSRILIGPHLRRSVDQSRPAVSVPSGIWPRGPASSGRLCQPTVSPLSKQLQRKLNRVSGLIGHPGDLRQVRESRGTHMDLVPAAGAREYRALGSRPLRGAGEIHETKVVVGGEREVLLVLVHQ